MEANIKTKLQGIFAPIATPFKDNEDIDLEALNHNLSLYEQTEIRGYLTLGSNGENKSLTEIEKLDVLETILGNKDRKKTVIVGIMYEAQRHAEQFIKQVAGMGAEFALVQSPSYFKKLMTDENLYSYFSALADSASVPLLIYNSPGFNGITLSFDLLKKISQHPNIVGMKDSTPGCDIEVMQLNSDSFYVMPGSITKLNDFVHQGAIGGTVSLANYCPDPAVELYNRLLEKESSTCTELNNKIVEANKSIAGRFGVPGVKAAMNLTGFKGGIPRKPLNPLRADQIEMVRSALVQVGALSE